MTVVNQPVGCSVRSEGHNERETAMILVAGATGLVGSEVCRLLRMAHRPVRALVRPTVSAEKREALRAIGCTIAFGDLRDPASLRAACAGADAVICSASAMPFSWSPPDNVIQTVDLDGVKALIDAAQGANAGHFSYVTFSGNIDLDFPLRNAKRKVEAYLCASGLNYTILRPSFFMEVWLSSAVGFDGAAHTAAIYGAGDNKLSWISYADVAKYAVASLEHAAARNATLELGGPEALSPLEVVAIFEQVSGQPFTVTHVPVQALEAQQAAAADDMQASFTGLMRCYAAGDPIPMAATSATFGIAPLTVREFAERVMAMQVLVQ